MGYKSFGMTKGLPYGIFMKHEFQKMVEFGQLDRLKEKWKIRKPDCKAMVNTGNSLSLEKSAKLFLIILGGSFLAFLLSILEKLFQLRDYSKAKKIIDPLSFKKFKILLTELHDAPERIFILENKEALHSILQEL